MNTASTTATRMVEYKTFDLDVDLCRPVEEMIKVLGSNYAMAKLFSGSELVNSDQCKTSFVMINFNRMIHTNDVLDDFQRHGISHVSIQEFLSFCSAGICPNGIDLVGLGLVTTMGVGRRKFVPMYRSRTKCFCVNNLEAVWPPYVRFLGVFRSTP